MSEHEHDVVLSAEGLKKTYPPATHALRGVSVQFRAGQIHGIAGVNGAGKSTLIKILAGVEAPTAGTISLQGVGKLSLERASDAQAVGIGVVHQELPLLPNLTAAENVDLGTDASLFARSKKRAIQAEYTRLAGRFPGAPPAGARLEHLGLDHWQIVAIIRALSTGARILILDEATSTLSQRQREALHGHLRAVASTGIPVVYVSHFLDDVLNVCDHVTVIRDGIVAAAGPSESFNTRQLLLAMTAEELPEAIRGPFDVQVARSQIRGLSATDLITGVVGPLSIEVSRGERVGLYGREGSGAREVVEALFGLRRSGGVVTWNGQRLPRGTAQRIARGLALVSGDRKRTLISNWSVAMNCGLPTLAQRGLLKPVGRGAESSASMGVISKLAVKGSPSQALRTLSGGNQQKVALGRWLVRDDICLLADEPTRGVDARGRIAIHELLVQLAERGNCLIVNSTDPEELVAVCNRVIVLEQGQVVAELVGKQITVKQLEAELHGTALFVRPAVVS